MANQAKLKRTLTI